VSKVSVIIPTYNRARVLRKTLKSVLTQTLQDFEIVIVDDGSQDDTRQAVEEIEDSRIRYFYKPNGGAASARNMGLSKARGDFIAFLDSDDRWPENFLEVMVAHMERNVEFGAAYTPITVAYGDGRQTRSYKRPEGKSGWIALDLFRRGFVWPSGSLFRRSVWEEFFFDETMRRSYEDGDAFLRLALHTQFLFVPDVEPIYNLSDDSISTKAGVACTRILVLERFYSQLGGDKVVPAATARRRLSHACRKVAEDRRRSRRRAAALILYRRAIRHWPFDWRLYMGLLRATLLHSRGDDEPNWQMPEPFGDPIGPSRYI